MKLEDKILKTWKKEYIFERSSDYTIYPVEDMQVIITTDENVLKQYKNIPRKGVIEKADDKYELDILHKVSSTYDIELHPNLYYVMWSN